MNWIQQNRRTVSCYAATTLCGVAGILYFYRGFFFGDPVMLQGNVGDGALTLFISGHWSAVSQAMNPLRDLGFFYPAPDTLGYSDTMFLFGALEWPMTVLGIPATVRFQAALVVLSAIGFAGSVALFRVGPRVSWPLAIGGGLVFAFGSGPYIGSDHPQLLALNLLPLIGLLAIGARRLRSWRSGLAAVGCGLLTGLVAYSAFYIGWFILLSLGLVGIVVVLFARAARRSLLSLKEALWRLAGFCAGLGLGLVPFVYTYGPVLAQGRERPIDEMAAFALTPSDLFNVSSSNLLWGRLVSQPGLLSASHAGSGEFQMTPTPVLIVVAVVLGIWAARRLRALTGWGHVGLASVIVGLLLWVAPLKVGPVFPWAVSLYRLPGGEAVRAIGRIELAAGTLVIFGSIILLNLWLKQRRGSLRPAWIACVGVVAGVVLIEQLQGITVQTLPLALVEDLAEVPQPPVQCQSFVVTDKRRADDPPYVPQTEAALVSQRIGVPTWNGYSGFTPSGWELFDVGTPAYRRQVRAWGTSNGLLGHGCGLNLATGKWLGPAALWRTTAQEGMNSSGLRSGSQANRGVDIPW